MIQPGDRLYSRGPAAVRGPARRRRRARPGHRLRHERGPPRSARGCTSRTRSTWPGSAAAPGEGVLRHRHDETQVLTVKSGRWEVTLNDGGDDRPSTSARPTRSRCRPAAGARFTAGGRRGGAVDRPGTGELLVVNSGDGRVCLEWAPEVVDARLGGRLDARPQRLPRAGRGDGHRHRGRLRARLPSRGSGQFRERACVASQAIRGWRGSRW